MRKPRVVLVHPPTKLYPFEIWPAAFDGLDVETVTVECRTRAEALEAVRGADIVMIGFFKVDALLRGEWPDRVVNPAVYGRLRTTGRLSR
jgi:hypothetical protein